MQKKKKKLLHYDIVPKCMCVSFSFSFFFSTARRQFDMLNHLALGHIIANDNTCFA